MKFVLYVLLFFAVTMSAQTNYEKGMQKAFSLWEDDKLDEASNMFERIATVEKDNWLPVYYIAQIAILKNWKDFENRNESELKLNLDKSQDFLNRMRSMEQSSPYADFLQAQLYTVWVAHDGMKYGMKYAAKIGALYERIVKIEPDNPIFIASKAEWDMGTARYFGKAVTPYCNELQRAISLFPTFKPASEFHPKGDIKRVLKSAEACK
ncbi:hypothetical protein [Dokdonia sp. Hel_I_53]|uniref:hypothetical protein n=1 Tax=Dokdonia sp. Hel_I_53 TaxID=1566287 RepID=UPI0011990B98|nr:hypothetical protein [Dokdonia sp. Hel_I_53]TVZ51584.1 hypothetical protein OD90_0732 [Dokdonia sp. Hel_I_53]